MKRKQTLLQEVADECERAYRRGFQHGFLTDADSADVFLWRSGNRRSLVSQSFDRSLKTSTIERLEMENSRLVEALRITMDELKRR